MPEYRRRTHEITVRRAGRSGIRSPPPDARGTTAMLRTPSHTLARPSLAWPSRANLRGGLRGGQISIGPSGAFAKGFFVFAEKNSLKRRGLIGCKLLTNHKTIHELSPVFADGGRTSWREL